MAENNGNDRKPKLRLIPGGKRDRRLQSLRDTPPRLELHRGSRDGASSASPVVQAPTHSPEPEPSEVTSLRRGWIFFEYSNKDSAGDGPHFVEHPSTAHHDPSSLTAAVMEPTNDVFDPTIRSIVQIVDAHGSVPMRVAGMRGSQYVVLHKERSAAEKNTTTATHGKIHPRDSRRLSLGVAALDLLPETMSGGVIDHLNYVHQRYAHSSQEHLLSLPDGLADKKWLDVPRSKAAFGALIDSLYNGKSTHAELHVPTYNKADAVSTVVGSLALLELLYGDRPVIVVRSEDSNGIDQLAQQAEQLGGIVVRLRLDAHGEHDMQQQPLPASALGQWLLKRLSAPNGIASMYTELYEMPLPYQRGSLVERLDALYNRHVVIDHDIHRIAEQYRQHCYEERQRELIEKIRSQYSIFTTLRAALLTLDRHYNALYRRLWRDRRVFTVPPMPDPQTMEYAPNLTELETHLRTLGDAIQQMRTQISDEDDALLRTKYRIDVPSR